MSAADIYPCVISSISPEDGGGYVACFPDIPGCLGIGETLDEALADARQALLACLDALKAVDREPPVPSSSPG
ncbi:type II toxin-antitoxin system HicB family antitoxin [Methylocapsa palsarum]|uniref:Predicted nuclease of the RNAse H fold, HicB family n=1 Tax=Methylocapsa palsarum TaxID=1612308 RepID=A0A1I4ARF3_9HYPH|nr:type II toxin-antitoxin system HicB family antitoxin [Methylocapsa palsarum]SFK58537.1 Predicted nuclease of the RNAse H fold, HicB family [Methylocapsa palsarum]